MSEDVIRLWDTGMTNAQISDCLGVRIQSVVRIISCEKINRGMEPKRPRIYFGKNGDPVISIPKWVCDPVLRDDYRMNARLYGEEIAAREARKSLAEMRAPSI